MVVHAASDLGAFHHIAATALVDVFDIRKLQRTAAVLVALELVLSSLCIIFAAEFYHARAMRASVRLVLNLSALDFTDGCK